MITYKINDTIDFYEQFRIVSYELSKVKYLYIYIVGNEEKKIFTIFQIESNTWKRQRVIHEFCLRQNMKKKEKRKRRKKETRFPRTRKKTTSN